MTPIFIAGYDGTKAAGVAVRFAVDLAQRESARVIAAYVGQGIPEYLGPGIDVTGSEQVRRELHAELRKYGEELLAQLEGGGLETRVELSSSPARGLQRLAAEVSAELIAIGASHRTELGRRLLGSVATRLLSGAPCAVAVVPDDYAADRIATIGVAYDATEEAKLALEHACRLADRLDAGLLILTVAEPVVFPAAVPDLSRTHVEKSTHRWLEQQLDKAVKESPVPAEGRMLKGEAPHALAEAIDDGLDMLVLGSRGYGPVRSVLLGSTSRALVDRLQCPVMVVPRAATG